MKKLWIISLVIALTTVPMILNAQANLPFFNSKGTVRIQTTELDMLADTIATVNHRADDIVWSRVVYRVIDMREKQNYQLYFPMRANDQYRSLFRVMLDAVCAKKNPLIAYKRNARELKPLLNDSMVLKGEELSKYFAYDNDANNNLIIVDPVTKKLKVGNDYYMKYVKNQMKFLIQEIVFFDKHTSRMYSKIMTIAPLYALHPDNTNSKLSFKYFQESVICWFAFDEFRQFLSKQYVIPNGNETQRLTYDDFFSQKLYSSYLVGDSNMFNKMLLENQELSTTPEKFQTLIRKEQKRIETEIMNAEQDLWEY
jgi:gliding motility associated protien GldN